MAYSHSDRGVTVTVVTDPETRAPDPSDALPLIDRLLRVAGDHDGLFVIVGIGEDPSTGSALTPQVGHVLNRQADGDARSRLMAAIEQVSRRPGANACIAPVLFRPDLPTGKKGGEADVRWQLGIVSCFGQKQDLAMRHQRLPICAHAEVKTGVGNFETWTLFDQPYAPDRVKPVLQALAAEMGDDCEGLDRLFWVPGCQNWPNRREREKLGRSPVPVRAELVMLLEPWEDGVALDDLKAVMLAKWGPEAFTQGKGEPIAAKFAEDPMLLTALQRVLREATLPTDIPTGPEPSPAQAPIPAVRERPARDNVCSGADPELKGTIAPADSPDAADAPVGSEDLAALAAPIAPKSDVCRPAASRDWLSHGRFKMSEAGLFETVNRRQGSTSEHICPPFWIVGHGRDASGEGWCRVLRWIDPDGREHEELVPDSELSGDARSIAAGLADKGLVIGRGKVNSFAEYLQGCSIARRFTVVDRTGWHEIDGRLAFVLPHCSIRPSNSNEHILKGTIQSNYQIRGTLEDWKKGVGALTMGQLIPVFAISTAFAGPILHLLGQESGCVHLFGESSNGKTTTLLAAASVWGSGATPGGYMRSWRTTDNGLEATASGANDTALILDEIGEIEPRAAHQAVYMLANGSGKDRATGDGSSRAKKAWRVLVLSSGETPSERKLAEARGKRAQAGQLVRMLDVPSGRGRGFGVFDHLGSFSDGASLSKALKEAAASAYGSAGPEFVRRILDKGTDKIAAQGKRTISMLCSKMVAPGDDPQVERAAERFALIGVAGELARELGVVPWAQGEALRAAASAFAQWLDARGGGQSAEEKRAIEQVRRIIEAHGEARFDEISSDGYRSGYSRPVANRLGWRAGVGPKRLWYIPPEIWKGVFCNGLDFRFVAKVLASHRMLRPRKEGPSVPTRIDGKVHRVYVLTDEILDGEREFLTIDEEYYTPPKEYAEGAERFSRLEAQGKVTRSLGEDGRRIFEWDRR